MNNLAKNSALLSSEGRFIKGAACLPACLPACLYNLKRGFLKVVCQPPLPPCQVSNSANFHASEGKTL